jgi:transcriptional regulator of arginine metabolism
MPTTSQRRRLIRALLDDGPVASQQALVEALAARGHPITQATASRDLRAVGAVKGDRGYTLVDPRHADAPDLARALTDFCENITPSGNLVVLKTPPGAAHLLGAAVDAHRMAGIAGTVAGDDTLLVVAEEGTTGLAVAERLERIGQGP